MRPELQVLGLVAICVQLVACAPSEADGRALKQDLVDVSAADRQTCAVNLEGTIECWGEGSTSRSPRSIRPGAGRFVRVGVYGECIYALTDTRELKLVSPSARCQAPPAGPQLDVAVGDVTCSIAEDTTLRCWNSVSTFSLCVPGTDGQSKCSPRTYPPPAEPFPGERFRSVAVGGHACAIRTDGAIRCRRGARTPPEPLPAGDWVELAIGTEFLCALDRSGAVSCWEGSANSTAFAPPVGVRFARIAANQRRVCGVDVDGAVYCWGEPFRWYSWTYAPPSGIFVDVTVGDGHACARKASGDTACWGLNREGQVTGTPISRAYRN